MTATRPNVDRIIERYRRLPARPEQRELQALYTDGCAEMLQLEAELLRLKRRIVAAEVDSAEDASAGHEAADLRGARDELEEGFAAIREIVRLMRTAVDWTDRSARSEPAA
jgi:transcription elongation GreA/GreB family factor